MKTQVGDLVGGIGLYNDGNSVRLAIAADRFVVLPTGFQDDDDARVPFAVVGGQVYIDDAVIRDASIDTAKIRNGFLTNLAAVHGTLQFARITKGDIFDLTINNIIQSVNFVSGVAGWAILRDGSFEVNGGTFRSTVRSSNFVAGTAGWIIRQNGTAEFDAGVIRGVLSAEHIDSDVRNFTHLWTGNLGLSASVQPIVLGLGWDDYSALHFIGEVFGGVFYAGAAGEMVPPGSTEDYMFLASVTPYVRRQSATSIGMRLLTGNARIQQIWGIGFPGGTPIPPDPPDPDTTTVSANAGSDVSVESGGSVQIGGTDAITNPVGTTTYAWSRISGTGGSLSSTTIASPSFNAPTVTSDRDIVWRKTTTNNGVSDTDDVTVTVMPAAEEAPGAPSTPTLSSRTATSLTLATVAGGGGTATTYRWRISTNSTVSNADPMHTSSGPSITITGLKEDDDFWIDVRAENSEGDSSYSGDLATSTLAAPIEAPGTPSTPTRTGRTSTSLTLATVAGGGGTATTYRWRISTNSTVSDGDPMHTSSGPSITITGLDEDSDYWIDVRAENSEGDSSYSGDLATSTLAGTPDTTVTANAGSDVSVESGGSVQIGGTDAITNPVGTTTYAWIKISGTGSTLSSTSVASPTFNAPTVTSDRDIVWRKTTTNNGVSDTDDVTVTVMPAAEEAPGAPSTPTLSSRTATSLTLATVAGGGGTATTYRWRISVNDLVTDSDPMHTSSGPSITITGLDEDSDYWIDVRAENSEGDSSYSGDLATSTLAGTPDTTVTANAGSNKTTAPGTSVSIGGTPTIVNPVGTTTYRWTRISGIGVALNDSTSQIANPLFNDDASGDFVFEVTVTNNGVSDTDRVTVTVEDPTTVSANAGSDVSVESGGSVQIGGTDAITNPVGTTTYAWSRISGTGGSLSSTTIASPSFNAPTVTSDRDIVWRKRVTNNGVFDDDDMTVTVNSPTETTIVTANAGDDRTALPGETIFTSVKLR